jgi:hypothetical protein
MVNRLFSGFLVVCALCVTNQTVRAGTVTVETNVVGATPAVVGYDSGHFWPASNTGDWLRYSGVSGLRIFVSPGAIEPSSQFPAVAQTVTNAASFLSLKAAVRANPWSTNYLNWSYVTNQFNTPMLIGSDYVDVDYDLSTLQQLGAQVVIQSTATTGQFNITTWTGQWQLWQFYYQQAFFLGAQYNVERYQMYNEPDNGGPTGTNYLIRLQLVADAVQAAIADVNTMYGKSLVPIVMAPVTAGAPTSTFATWGELVVTNRHVNFLGQSNAGFSLIQKYDYHEYGGSPPNPPAFANNLTFLESKLATFMAPEAPYPVTITEFNVYDGSVFESLSTSLDTPLNYSALGAIAVNLLQNGINELYCFKFSQTTGSGYLAKNGTHYVNNTNAPYNVGGITKGGEVWRLINKGFAPGRSLLGYQTDSQTAPLNLLAAYDPAAQRYYLLSVNNTASSVALNVNLAAWQIPAANEILVEAVNESSYGAGILATNAGALSNLSLMQGSNSVWLFTVPAQAQPPPLVIPAVANAQVADGVNKNNNYAGLPSLVIEDNSTNAAYRSAALLQFQVPALNATNLGMALLTVSASTLSNSASGLAYAYGLTNTDWTEDDITWATAPNLAQNIPPGAQFANEFVLGEGASAFMLGQLVAGPAPATYSIDLTAFLRGYLGTNISILLARQVRFGGDAQDGSGVSVVSLEGGPGNSPKLQLFLSGPLPPVLLQAPQLSSGGAFSFTLSGPVGYAYDIQSSVDLIHWSVAGTVTNNGGSVQILLDNTSQPNQSFYYRAVLNPSE